MRTRLLFLVPLMLGAWTRPGDVLGQPKAVVDREEHDFGAIDVGTTGRHDFVLTNAGDRPLELSRGRVTCGCCTCVCTTKLPDPATIAPGKSAKVTLEWVSKMYTGPFRQSTTLLTNDPQRAEVTLRVAGRFVTAVRAVPPGLVFSRISAGQPATGELRVYGYLSEPLKVGSWEWADAAAAKHFEVALDPLTAEQLRGETGAQSGYRVRVTVKPGLPAGPFSQQVTVKTNSKSAPTVKIPVKGMVTSDVSVVGPGWDAETGVLAIGTVSSGQGAALSLRILVRGAQAKNVRIKVVRVVPELLKVELGQTAQLAGGAVSQTGLTLRIPPGSPPASHVGPEQAKLGQIILETSHPDVPQLQMLVRFAVEK